MTPAEIAIERAAVEIYRERGGYPTAMLRWSVALDTMERLIAERAEQRATIANLKTRLEDASLLCDLL